MEYIPTIRLSDCLAGYSQRVLPEADEARYAPVFPDRVGYQGNILNIPQEDPNYRAKRRMKNVLKNLDPRLRDRANSMIRAAEEVMARYARSPWGWVVYYSWASTFVSHRSSNSPDALDRGGVELLRPTTPGGRPKSKDAGPKTGGK